MDLDEGDERRHERLAETYHLTERETVCLLLALDGMTSAAIAERLGIKAPTVRAYQQRAYRKMEVASLTEARELVARQAVVEPLSSPDTLLRMNESPLSVAARVVSVVFSAHRVRSARQQWVLPSLRLPCQPLLTSHGARATLYFAQGS